jgi:hypothetical protein
MGSNGTVQFSIHLRPVVLRKIFVTLKCPVIRKRWKKKIKIINLIRPWVIVSIIFMCACNVYRNVTIATFSVSLAGSPRYPEALRFILKIGTQRNRAIMKNYGNYLPEINYHFSLEILFTWCNRTRNNPYNCRSLDQNPTNININTLKNWDKCWQRSHKRKLLG